MSNEASVATRAISHSSIGQVESQDLDRVSRSSSIIILHDVCHGSSFDGRANPCQRHCIPTTTAIHINNHKQEAATSSSHSSGIDSSKFLRKAPRLVMD